MMLVLCAKWMGRLRICMPEYVVCIGRWCSWLKMLCLCEVLYCFIVVNANIWPYNIYSGASEWYCTLNDLDETGGMNVVVLPTASKSAKCDDFTVVIFCYKFCRMMKDEDWNLRYCWKRWYTFKPMRMSHSASLIYNQSIQGGDGCFFSLFS